MTTEGRCRLAITVKKIIRIKEIDRHKRNTGQSTELALPGDFSTRTGLMINNKVVSNRFSPIAFEQSLHQSLLPPSANGISVSAKAWDSDYQRMAFFRKRTGTQTE